MSLLLNGAKTMTIAGTEMSCLEIYTGEAYTFPLAFVDGSGNAANAQLPNNWVLSTEAKFYTVDTVTYPTPDTVNLGNITLNNVQPNSTAYTVIADWSNISNATGYLYISNNITGTANLGIPNIALANTAANSTLVIVTLTVSKESNANSFLTDINREPIGFIIRYQ